ncbi:MAG TPA: hypothetical protein VIL46_11555, partial [Gemmataceae bacterium]
MRRGRAFTRAGPSGRQVANGEGETGQDIAAVGGVGLRRPGRRPEADAVRRDAAEVVDQVCQGAA